MIRKFVAAAVLLVGGLVGAQAAPVLSFTPSSTNVTVGQIFSVDIRIAGVTDLFGWQLDMAFAPAGLLNALTVTEGSFLGAGTVFDGGTISNALGTITTMFDALTGSVGVDGSGLLATVSFQAGSTGVANLSFANVLLQDSNLDGIFFDNVTGSGTATVNITQAANDAPEPSTLALMLLALTAAGACRRRAADAPVIER